MKIRVLLFARYREAAEGTTQVEVDVPNGATIRQVWAQVQLAVPALREEGAPLFACDREYARSDRVLTGMEEIAAFPPVSGG